MQRFQLVFLSLILLTGVAPALAGGAVPVTGTVVGSDGKPVLGATVIVQYVTPAIQWERVLGKQRATSGPDGRFAVTVTEAAPGSPFIVVALKAGLAVGWVSAPAAKAADLSVTLAVQPVSCSGRLTDDNGHPLAGASVRAEWISTTTAEGGRGMTASLPEEDFPAVTTDDQGRFELRGFPSGCRLSLHMEAAERVTERHQVTLPAADKDTTFALGPGGSIAGRVLVHGTGAPDLRFTCLQQTPTTGAVLPVTTGRDGSYRLSGLPAGSYRFGAPGAEATATKLLLRPVTITLKAGEQRAGVDLEASAGATITGHVSVPADAGDPGGIVVGAADPTNNAAGDGRGMQMARVDDAGNYVLRVRPGKLTVAVMANRLKAEPEQRPVQIAEGETVAGVDFTLRVPPGVSGRVVGPDGQPAVGVEVSMQTGVDDTPARTPKFTTVKTDADGKFQFGGSQWYANLIVARDPAKSLIAAANVNDPKAPALLRLKPGAYVTAHVVDEQGKPLEGIPVEVRQDYGRIALVASDARGLVRLGPLPPSNRNMWFNVVETYRDRLIGGYSQLLTLAPGDEVVMPPVMLNLAGRSLQAQVVDEAGKPVAGASVYGSGNTAPATTDAAGHFTLTGLAAQGEVWVIALHPSEPLVAAVRADLYDTRPLVVALKPPVTAAGRVVDQQGKPLAGRLTVQAGGPDGRYPYLGVPLEVAQRLKSADNWQSRADADGRWTVPGLFAGVTYTVWVSTEDGRSSQTDFKANSAGTIAVPDLLIKGPALARAGAGTPPPPPPAQ